MSTGAGASDLLHAEDTGVDEIISGTAPVAARSPLQLFWRRLKRDKVALTALGFIVILILSAIFTGVALAGKIAGPLRLEVWNASLSVRTLSRPLIVAAVLFLVHTALDRPRHFTRHPAGGEPC